MKSRAKVAVASRSLDQPPIWKSSWERKACFPAFRSLFFFFYLLPFAPIPTRGENPDIAPLNEVPVLTCIPLPR
jgi:hypothetical protein